MDLSGWSLSDSNGHGSSGSVTIDAGTALAGGEYLVVVLRASDGLLNNGGDDLELYDASAVLVDELTWSSSAPGDLSMARLVRTAVLLLLLRRRILILDADTWRRCGTCRQPDGGSWSTSWRAATRGATNGSPAPAAASGGLAASLAAAGPAGGVAACASASHTPLRLGSWNIQNFGNAKSGRTAVMAAIGGIASRYDVLSVQELSQLPSVPGSCSVDGTTGLAACTLLDALNAASSPRTFQLAASPRACTASSCTDENYDEQYLVVFDSARVELVSSAIFPDPSGAYARDPWAAHLREIASGTEFALLSIHTPPSEAEEEILAMGAVLEWAVSATHALFFSCSRVCAPNIWWLLATWIGDHGHPKRRSCR